MIARGLREFAFQQYEQALESFKQGESENEVQSKLNQAITYFQLRMITQALQLLNQLDSLQIEEETKSISTYYRALCLFNQQNFQDALTLLQTINHPNAQHFIQKCQQEVKAIKKFNWFQTQDKVTVEILAKAKQEDVKVDIQETTLAVSIKKPEGGQIQYNYNLYGKIDPSQSNYIVTPTKLELYLKKADLIQWFSFEKQQIKNISQNQKEQKPSYPSSAKNKVDWNKLDKNIEKELSQEKPEGEAALNELFKQIYDNADEDKRRAMIKSFQTSGGTVLSTNWEEVEKKDYQGKDRPEPPKGQEWREWSK